MENLKTQTQNFVRRTRSSVPKVTDTESEKSCNQSQPPQELYSNQTRENPKPDDIVSPSTENQINSQTSKRLKWSKEEYIEVIIAHYHAALNPQLAATQKETYQIWRARNPNVRPYIDPGKLANVQRDIFKRSRLSKNELSKIKKDVQCEIKSNKGSSQIPATNAQSEGIIPEAGLQNGPSHPDPDLDPDPDPGPQPDAPEEIMPGLGLKTDPNHHNKPDPQPEAPEEIMPGLGLQNDPNYYNETEPQPDAPEETMPGLGLQTDLNHPNEPDPQPDAPEEVVTELDSQIEVSQLVEPSVSQTSIRQKWSKHDYTEVIYAHYHATLNPQLGSKQKETYHIWRTRNPDIRPNIDSGKLANIQRDIFKQYRLTQNEINKIKQLVQNEIKAPVTEPNPQPDAPDEIAPGPGHQINSNQPNDPGPQTDAPEEIMPGLGQQNLLTNHTDDPDMEELLNEILNQYAITKDIPFDQRDTLPKVNTNNKNKNTIEKCNKAVEILLPRVKQNAECEFSEINNLIYSAALVSTTKCGIKVRKRNLNTNVRKNPAWIEKINKEIKMMRADISFLKIYNEKRSQKHNKVKKISSKYNLHKCEMDTKIEILKQKIQLKAKRIDRYKKRSNFYKQNKTFKENAKKFYRELGKSQITVEKPPKKEEMEEFWKGIWTNPKPFNENAEWIKTQETKNENVETQTWEDISKEEVSLALKKSHKWKSPGCDKIPNFWLNTFTSAHDDHAKMFNKAVLEPESAPAWLTKGITYLHPKSNETENPKNYRPITCLTTLYKILTSIITERTYTFLDANDLLPTEQKGCKRGSYGCKDQLLIDKMILENCKTNSRNLATAWIDYKKAFDSVPHEWIIKALEIFKISPQIVNFIKISMQSWSTSLILSHIGGSLTSNDIDISCGIFQGDSLSPLLFCLALIPLTTQLNEAKRGYKIHGQTINHLFYMDDLKLFAQNEKDLEDLLNIVKDFSDDIGMEFGLDKCATATFKHGKFQKSTNIQLDANTVIRNLDQDEVYKYLGVHEGDGIRHAKMKEQIRKECYRRVRLVLETELNAVNRINAINTLAIPVVTYSFGIINWSTTDLSRVDCKIRKLLTAHRMHHPKADVDRMYLPRREGGRGLIQLELTYNTTIIGLDRYLETTNDKMLQAVLIHENSKKVSITKLARKLKTTFNVQPTEAEIGLSPTAAAKAIKNRAKSVGLTSLDEKWKQKPLHGKYPDRLAQPHVDVERTNQWLHSSGLKAETEGFLIAAQDQSLATNLYKAKIIKDGTDPLCRICKKADESVDHLISACSVLAPKEYLIRHDRVGQYIHWKVCKFYQIPVSDNWYEHHPKEVTNRGHITIIWNLMVHTDRTIGANKPDIIIKDTTEKTCLLIDMCVPADTNVSLQEFDKLSKYKDLEIEIKKMWHLKPTVIPVVIGALGLIKKGTEKHIEKIPGKISLSECQKIALMGTAHILRKTLSM